MSEFRLLIKCPRCWAINALHTPYLKCYNCNHVDEKDVSYQINEIELEQRKKIEAIIKSLFPTNPPTISFPESSINPETGDIDWGWANINTNALSIPRKTFYCSNEQLIDTAVHESNHLLTQIGTHSPTWYSLYLQQREKVFATAEFANFANSNKQKVKFTKGYSVYPESNLTK